MGVRYAVWRGCQGSPEVRLSQFPQDPRNPQLVEWKVHEGKTCKDGQDSRGWMGKTLDQEPGPAQVPRRDELGWGDGEEHRGQAYWGPNTKVTPVTTADSHLTWGLWLSLMIMHPSSLCSPPPPRLLSQITGWKGPQIVQGPISALPRTAQENAFSDESPKGNEGPRAPSTTPQPGTCAASQGSPPASHGQGSMNIDIS